MGIKSEFTRRDFLKIVGASAGVAATGCGQDLPEKIIPYVIQPEEVIPGIAAWYAGNCEACEAGCGVVVKTREGRAIKIEGNKSHPINRGGLCHGPRTGARRAGGTVSAPGRPKRHTAARSAEVA